jgi:hypothetical protein
VFVKATILFWDSDVSNVNESALSKPRTQYYNNVALLGTKVLDAGSHFAISGPGVLGVDGVFEGMNKTQMLDDYVSINRKVAQHLKVPYINARSHLLKSIAHGNIPTRDDGEHLDDLSVQIMGDLFIGQFI